MRFLKKSFRHINYFLQDKAAVFSYHRIADMEIDPWEICVSPENFQEHLEVLKSYNLLTPDQLSKHLKNRTLKNKMVCITFDDGYRDNFQIAKPLLEKYDSPATIFIPGYFIGKEKLFWWDELQSIILGKHDLPQVLSITIGNDKFKFDLGDSAFYNEIRRTANVSWIWHEETKTKRAELYLEIWKRLRPLKYTDINKVIEVLVQWCSCNISLEKDAFPINYDQLKEIIGHPLFDIGIHTVTHPALPSHPMKEQLAEITNCKQQLEELAGRAINTIAYPYGLYNDDTIKIAKQLHLELGFTTQGHAVRANDDPLQLARFHVKNWNGEEFEKKLNLWVRGF